MAFKEWFGADNSADSAFAAALAQFLALQGGAATRPNREVSTPIWAQYIGAGEEPGAGGIAGGGSPFETNIFSALPWLKTKPQGKAPGAQQEAFPAALERSRQGTSMLGRGGGGIRRGLGFPLMYPALLTYVPREGWR